MSGWIKLEKALRDDPRVLRMASRLRNADVTLGDRARAIVMGALAQLWCYADTHVRQDDTLDLGPDELDDFVGVPGFARLLPSDWLEIIDDSTVKLPNFHTHNGTESKKKALNQKRQERHRRDTSVTPALTSALPDQTRPDQTKPDVRTTTVAPRPAKADPPEFIHIRSAYPKRGGSQPWPKALKAAQARIREGDTWTDLLDGVSRYAEFVRATGKEGTEYVLQAATFFGPDKRYLEPWAAPATKADARYSANVSTARTWAEGQS
jgi:hypothetical protein